MSNKIARIILWTFAGGYGLFGMWEIFGAEPESGNFTTIWGIQLLAIAGLVALAILLARKWRGGYVLASIILVVGFPVTLVVAVITSMVRVEARQAAERKEQAIGKSAFGDQPALYAVAQAIVANDQEAVRAAAKALPDLQAAGGDGMTLLYFAVTRSWQYREAVASVKTLLSLGANPNYTNGQRNSFALGAAVHGPEAGLRAMLDAGGDPNARNQYGWPLVFMHFKLGYYQEEELARLDLLLDRGADINATVPETDSECSGYSLVLYTTRNGIHDHNEYACALHLLERGADPNRVAPDGMTVAKQLAQHRQQFEREHKAPPRQFDALWQWAEAHGLLAQR